MGTEERATDTGKNESADGGQLDPRDTEHPTGTKQAAENTTNDPPS